MINVAGVPIDIYVFHKWRDESNRTLVLKELDVQFGFGWRNFSNVWHDPIIHPSSLEGIEQLKPLMELQIKKAHLAIFVLQTFSKKKDSDFWYGIQEAFCHMYEIKIIGVGSERFINSNCTSIRAHRYTSINQLGHTIRSELSSVA